MNETDLARLRQAIAAAERARSNGNHPFGAVLAAADGTVVAEAENTVVTERDPTGHAETNLVRMAGRLFDPHELPGTTLYSSCEPCAMCSAAIYWAGIGRIVYALPSSTLRAMNPGGGPSLEIRCRDVIGAGAKPIVVDGPALESEAAVPHEGFWG